MAKRDTHAVELWERVPFEYIDGFGGELQQVITDWTICAKDRNYAYGVHIVSRRPV